ncbi:MAG: surface lipoprotein assembly modifier [Rhizobiaceae bacterium]
MRWTVRFIGFAMALCLTARGMPALADEPAASNVQPRIQKSSLAENAARRKILFAKMMANPANLDVAFEYAALSAQTGDLESAISTLERMLIFAPNVPRLQLELGVLYYRLGSYQLARNYLTAALRAPHVPPEVRARVEPYLAEIRNRTAVDRFNGTVTFGTRYQSNANGGASSDIVNIGGLPFVLSDAAIADSDVNGFVMGNFVYSHDLASQGDRFDAQLLTYGALYSDHHEVDTGLAELTFGPVISLDRFGFNKTDFGIYGILGGVVLHGDPYRWSGGIGARIAKAFTRDTRGELRVEYRYQDYRDSDLRPTASDRTGSNIDIIGTLRHQITNRFAAYVGVEGERHDARRGYESYWSLGATIGGIYLLDPLIGNGSRPWTADLSFGMLNRSYDEPDTLMAAYDRHDVETFVQGILTIPLRETWSMQTVVSYRSVNSNYDIDKFDNVSVSLGFTKSF